LQYGGGLADKIERHLIVDEVCHSSLARSQRKNHMTHNDSSVVAYFFLVSVCDWELTNELFSPVIILRLWPDMERKAHFVNVGHDGQACHRFCYHEK